MTTARGRGRRGLLVVLAKDPQPGQVKTRMTPPLSPQLAAAFYREMLADVLEESARACAALDLDGVVSVSPPSAARGLADAVPGNFRVVAQLGPDLGTRMAHELLRGLASGAPHVVLRGSDNPALACNEIASLCRALESADLAVSPDLDGGYGAIASRLPARGIFDHEMSSERVLRATLERAEGLGLASHTTRGSFDLDSVADLRQLARTRDALPAQRCPRTLAFADRHGLWELADRPALSRAKPA